MKKQTEETPKQTQLTHSEPTQTSKMKTRQSERQPNVHASNEDVDHYCAFLKELRVKYKPPILEDKLKSEFCQSFDGILLKRSLKEVTEFITQFRKRKASQAGPHFNHHHSGKDSPKEDEEEKRRKLSMQEAIKAQIGQQQIDKLLLYSWQLCNIRTIVSSESSSIWVIPNEVANNIHRLCISTSRIHVSKWGIRHVTMQAMQICYFNLLKNMVFDVDPIRNGSLCCLIEAILADTHSDGHRVFVNLNREFENMLVGDAQEPINVKKAESSSEKNLENLIPPPVEPLRKKSSAELQLEWFTYIIEHCICYCDQFIKQTYMQLSNGALHSPTPSSISFLHYIVLMLNKIVNDRTTTEIVKGYSCHIEDVKKMYNRGNSKQVGMEIKLSWTDYEWLLETLFGEMMRRYKKQLRGLWELQYYGAENEHFYNGTYLHCIMNIIGIVNCCNFLGGYSGQLQKRTSKLILDSGLEFLELSYLIYELCHAKKRNIEMKIQDTIQDNYITNLERVLQVEHKKKKKGQGFEIELIQISQQSPKVKGKNLAGILPLEEGQLVCIIRMLSNLVHINEHAQKVFEDNLKYFRIIMSLTHELESQITMKNWAIVFLRNVAERSSIMRAELEKLKIDVKVDNGTSPFM